MESCLTFSGRKDVTTFSVLDEVAVAETNFFGPDAHFDFKVLWDSEVFSVDFRIGWITIKLKEHK